VQDDCCTYASKEDIVSHFFLLLEFVNFYSFFVVYI
jgi:hypothetical protein